jgi:hypothetical protein
LHCQSWLPSLGDDLSYFMKFTWSSISSLRQCSLEIGHLYENEDHGIENDDDDDHEVDFQEKVWEDINDLFDRNDLVRWQEAWGGLFVSSLRMAAYRCLSLALYASYSKADPSSDDKLLRSEILESLGASLYSELMGSQSYGYPMKEMTTFRKRKLAEAALSCFEQAMELQVSVARDKSCDVQPPWDLSFMIGKVRRCGQPSCFRSIVSKVSETPSVS